jgi:hypothetical protein
MFKMEILGMEAGDHQWMNRKLPGGDEPVGHRAFSN